MFWLRPVRFFAEILTNESSPRQLALGFAIGAAIGLVPKGNLIAIALMFLLGAARVNLGAGMAAACLFSWVGAFADPFTHRLGESILTADPLLPMWTAFFDLPIVPWTSFNNTVVLGSLLLAIALFLPIYAMSEPLFARIVPPIQGRLLQFKVVQLLWGAEWSQSAGRS